MMQPQVRTEQELFISIFDNISYADTELLRAPKALVLSHKS